MSDIPNFLRSLEAKWEKEGKDKSKRAKLRYYYKNRQQLLSERYSETNPHHKLRLGNRRSSL